MPAIPKNFHTDILERFMSVKELEKLAQRYEDNKKGAGYDEYVPSDNDVGVYQAWLDEKLTLKEAAKEMGLKGGASAARHRFTLIGKMVIKGDVRLP